MADRAAKRFPRVISESDDGEGAVDNESSYGSRYVARSDITHPPTFIPAKCNA